MERIVRAPATRRLLLGLACLSLTLVALASLSERAWADNDPLTVNVTLGSYNRLSSQTVVTIDDRQIALKALGAKVQAALATARANDRLALTVDQAVKPTAITSVQSIGRPVDARDVALVVIASPLALLAAAFIATWGRPLSLVIGVDGQLSNSQVQLALWFGVVASAYAAMMCLRAAYLGWGYFGGVGLTTNVMVLTGLSGLTFGAAKAIGVQKSHDGDAAPPPPTPLPPAARGAPRGPNASAKTKASLLDLFRNRADQTDLGDFQMILVAGVAVGVFAVASIKTLSLLTVGAQTTLPDVDTTLLSTFGLGQGAYLIKKAVLPPGQG